MHPYYRMKAKETELYATVERFKTIAHSKGFNKGYKHYAKYYTLYNFIRTRKPQCVLECGSGVTTLVILLALKENGSGSLVSMDEDEFFGNTVRGIAHEMFPGSSFEMNVIPSMPGTYGDLSGMQYRELPDRPYDLMFVDGPQTLTIDIDPFYVLEKNPKIPVIIDVRLATVLALKTKHPSARFNFFLNLGFVNL